MTDKEIIKALECCYIKGTPCRDCPFNELEDCNYVLMAVYVFDLIVRQQTEIEKLKGWENLLKAESHAPIKAKARAEAIKEFAERLCEGRVSNDPIAIAVKVELKEMVGEGK